MSKLKLSKEELKELREYVKKLREEGSTTAGVPGYQTPAAFTGKEGGDGTDVLDLEDDQYAYSEKPPKNNSPPSPASAKNSPPKSSKASKPRSQNSAQWKKR